MAGFNMFHKPQHFPQSSFQGEGMEAFPPWVIFGKAVQERTPYTLALGQCLILCSPTHWQE